MQTCYYLNHINLTIKLAIVNNFFFNSNTVAVIHITFPDHGVVLNNLQRQGSKSSPMKQYELLHITTGHVVTVQRITLLLNGESQSKKTCCIIKNKLAYLVEA